MNKSSFTDDFDNALEATIKTYQLNFNLYSTEKLDDVTVKQILQSRCGVTDIVNDTTTMKSKFSIPKKSGVTTQMHYLFFPGSPRWGSRNDELTFAFLPENQLGDSVKGVFVTVFDRWAKMTLFTFTQTTSYTKTDIKIGFYSRNHGDGEPFDGV